MNNGLIVWQKLLIRLPSSILTNTGAKTHANTQEEQGAVWRKVTLKQRETLNFQFFLCLSGPDVPAAH